MLGLFASLSLGGRVGAVTGAACVALLTFCIWCFFGPEIRRQRLLTRGIPAEAEILTVEETGITVQGN